MKPNRRNPLFAAIFRGNTLATAIVISLANLAIQPGVQAASVYWDNVDGTLNDWTSVANWSTDVAGGITPGAVPGDSDLAVFSATSVVSPQTVNLNATQSLAGLSFTSAQAHSLLGGGTNPILTLGGSGIAKTGNAAVTIGSVLAGQQVALALSADQTWTNNDNSSAISVLNGVASSTAVPRLLTLGGTSTAANTVAGVIADNAGGVLSLTKADAGTWVLSGVNTYSGQTTVSGGILRPTVAGALPAGALTVNGGGTLDLATNNLNHTPASLAFGGMAGTAALTTGTGTLTLASGVTYDATNNPGTATVSGKLDLGGADRTFTVGDSSNSTTELTVASVLSGSNGIIKTGPGVLALTTASGNTFTGGTPASAILVNQGAVSFTADNQLGALANGITLNGGTLSQNGTTSTPTLSSLRVITIGPSNGTIDIQGVAAANKILLGTGNQLTGSGSITKTGGGTFQLTSANTTFSGDWTISGGYVEVQNANALGSGSVTVNNGGELVDSNSAILANNITLSGGTISSNTTGAFSGTITVSSPSTIAARRFNATGTGNSVNLTGTLTGGGDLTITGPTAGSGTVFLTGANTAGYTGVITINSSANLQLGGTGMLANNNALTLNGGTVSFLADGDGTGTPASITSFTDNISVTSSSAISVGRLGTTFSPLFTQAVNKTITLGGTFSIVDQTLTVNNNNGYGLSIPANLGLTGTPQFSIANATASNVVPGLTLGGQISGSFGLIKGGVGTMVLSNATNSFTGGLSVTGGVLAATSNEALGNTANGITLNGAAAAFAAFESFSTARTFTFSNATAANNVINVSSGKTLTITSAFSGANGFQKGDPGTLILSGANGSYAAAWTASGGITRLTSTASAGTGAITVNNNQGTTLQLDGSGGSLALTNAFNISNSGINSGGAIQNLAGTNSITGVITLGNDATIGADAGTTLNLNTAMAGAKALTLSTGPFPGNPGTGGAININAALPALTGLTKIGAGTATIGVASPLYVTALTVNGGTLQISGTATLGTAAVANTVTSGATLKVNDTTSAVNRLGTTRTMNLSSGTFNYVINGTASLESTGTLTSNWGGNTIQTDTNATGTSTLTFANLAGNAVSGGSTLTFKAGGTGLAFGSANNKVIFTAAPTLSSANIGIVPRGIVIDASGTNFATYNNTGLVANTNGIQALAASNIPTISSTTVAGTTVTVADTSVLSAGMAVYGPNIPVGATIAAILTPTTYQLSAAATAGTQNLAYGNTPYTDINALVAQRATADNLKLGSGFVTNGDAINLATRTFGSLNLSGPGTTFNSVVLSASGTYTLTSGNILSSGAGTNTLGAGAIVAFGAAEGGLNVGAGNTLQVNGTITNANNVTKGLDGNLTFASKQYFNTGGNYFTINGGTATLAGGNHTLFPGVQGGAGGQYLAVGPGATLDLNGTAQLVGDLRSPNSNAFVGSGGTVTSTTAATFVNAGGAATANWGGRITDNVFFAKGGNNALSIYNDNSFTGGLLLMGNTTQFLDSGKLSGLTVSTPININYAGLQLNNTGTLNDFDRVPDTVPINLRGGVVTFNGRAQTTSAETLGALSLVQGWNNIAVTAAGTGINSADLTFASLTRPAGSAATINFTNVAGDVTANGQIGSQPRLHFTTAPATTNNLIGPWAFILREWAGYVPGLGVGQLNAAGFAGYSTNTLDTGVATDNIKITNTAVTLTGNATVNSLIYNWSSTANGTMDLGGNTLTLQGGGLMITTGSNTTTGSINNGFVTSGLPTVGGDLYVNFTPFAGTNRKGSFGAAIKDNGLGGTVRLVVTSTEAAGTAQSVTLDGLNTYTGGTVVNGGTLNIGATGTLPGNGITLNAGGLTQTASGVINSTNIVTFNGPSTMTLVGNNTLDSLVFNNNGGVANPTATSGGVLSLSNATPISVVLPSNPSTVATVAGTLDFANASKTISVDPTTINGQSVAPLTAGLNISALIQNAGQLVKTGTGNLQLSSTSSTFTGGVSVTAGGLIIGATSVGPIPLGQTAATTLISGPLGTGTLTMGANTTLLASAANTVGNVVALGGNLTFDGLNNLTLAGAISLPAATDTSITVAAPQMTATLGGIVSGAGSSITLNGLGVLSLGVIGNTFNGDFTINSGTLQGSSSLRPFGTGDITINGGVLALKNNAGGTIGNNVILNPALPHAFIDINNNGNAAAIGNTFVLGNLNSQVTTTLDVSGGNGYRLQFTGTNLTAAGTPASFNPAAGLTIVLPGSFNDANRPVNIGLGVLALGGTNFFTSDTTITGTQGAAPQANAISSPYGVGNNVILANGSTLQITPTANTLNDTGYTQGGLAGRFFSFASAPTLNAIAGSGLVPGAAVGGVPSSDANTFNHPPGINNSGGAAPVQDIEHYVGSLNIAAGGTYSFALNADDQAVIFVDGLKIVGLRDTGGSGGYSTGFNTGAISLSAGLHSIVVMHQNGTGGSGFQLMYNGPDTAAIPGAGWQNIAKGNLYYSTGTATAGNGYLNAAQLNNAVALGAGHSATLDGLGSQFNSTVASLNLGNGSTLTVNNAQGTGFIGSIGTTTLGTGVTINTNSGMLNLIGGVTDSGNGLTKIGTATLMLGASAGTFTGALNINQGGVQLTTANGLTTGTTRVGNPNIATVAAGNTLVAGTTVTVASTAGLFVGEGVSVTGGTGTIPAGATITAITSPTTFTLSAAATAGTPTLTYYGGGVLDLNGISNVAGNIIISGQGPLVANTLAPGALYNSSATAASVSGGVAIGAALNAATPAIGGYGDINIGGIVSDNVVGQAWRKVGPNTLTLSGNNNFTGALTVSGGILKLGSTNALGTSATNGITFTTNASAIDLAGQSPAAAKTLTFGANNLGVSGLAINNTLGALVNNTPSTTSTYAGALVWTGALGIGSSSYDPSNPGGDIVLSAAILNSGTTGIGINKVGQNKVTILGSVPTTTGGHNIQMGTLVLSGTAGAFTGGSPVNISSGATLLLNNETNKLNNRLGSLANASSFLQINGNLTIIGNAAGSQELIATATNGKPNFVNSGSVITLQPNASGGLLFNFTSNIAFARSAGATSLFRGAGLGTATLASFTGAANPGVAGFGDGTQVNPGFIGSSATTGTSRGVLPWALVDTTNTGLGTSFAAYDTTNGFRALNFAGVDGVTDLLTAGTNVLSSTGVTTVASSGINAINSLTLNGGAATISVGSTLQIASGGLLNLSGTVAIPNTISGASVLSTAGNAELIIHSPGTTALNITAQIAGTTGGLTKADGGTVILGAQQLYTGNTTINGGTLQLAGGDNQIFITPNAGQSPGNSNPNASQQVLQVNQGGTFDLNGNTQMVANFNSANTLPNTGGTLTNTHPTTTATFQTVVNGSNQTFAGAIRGNLDFIRSGGWSLTLNSASDFTGTTTIQSGQTILTDLGAITGTSAIALNGGALTWTDTGSQSVANRLPATAPLTFNTGAFTYNARNGTQGAITIGNANLNSGSSLITLTPSNGGANLTIGTGVGASLTREVGSAVTFTSGGTGGGIGDHTHVYLGSVPAQPNGIIGAWATAYQNDAFIGQSTQPGFAIYTSNGIQTLNPNLVTIATGNVPTGVNARMNGNLTLPAGGSTLNTLSIINSAATITFAAAADTLTVTTGGILTGADNAKAIGQSANFGQLTAGAGQSELFLHNGANTLTVNARIIDNGVVGGLNVVADSMANGTQTLVLTAPNSYLGATYLNNINTTLNATGGPAIPGNLVITGGVSGSDSLNATTTFAQGNQIASGANVTLKGGATLNLAGFSNTINNLVLDNTSGGLSGVSATVRTGTGVLTVAGGITETANNNGFLVPQINGFLTLSNAAPTISIAANPINATMVGLDLAAAVSITAPTTTPLILTGGGVIAINGQSLFANGTNVTAGTTLAFGPAAATTGAAVTFGSIANSQVNLAGGTVLDTRGNTGVIGSLTGSGIVTNLSLASGTLITGADNVSSTLFSGTFTNPFVQGLLSLTKIGTGTMEVTGNSSGVNSLNSPNLGTLTVSSGNFMIKALGRTGFSTNNVQIGASLTLNNTTDPVNNRLGGQYLMVSPTVATPTTTTRTLNMQGGTLNILGNTGTAITEGIGQLNNNGGTITLNSTGTSGVTLSVVNFANQGGQSSLLVQGDNLGKFAAGTTNSSNLTISGSFNIPGATGGGAAGTTNMSVRGDVIALDTLSGVAGFATNAVNGLRPLDQTTELLNSTATLVTNAAVTAPTAFNLGLGTGSPLQTILHNSGANTLTLLSGGGLANTLGANGDKFGSAGLQTLTLSNAGILALSGNTGVNVGAIASGGITFDLHVQGAATTLNFNSSLVSTTQGMVKAGDGTVTLSQPQFFTGANGNNGLTINGGTVVLAGGANTILVQPTGSVPTLQSLFLNTGTLDLNGNSQAFERIASINTAPGQANNIITSTAAANLITVPANNVTSTYAGSIGGAISLFKEGAGGTTGTLILTNSNSYTGSTNVVGGTLTLRDSGAITGPGAININYGTLLLDNTGLSDSTSRIPVGSAINLNGGTFAIAAGQAVESQNIGTVTLAQGLNQISLSQYNNNAQTGSYTLNVANLVQTNKAVINFPNNTGVTLGQTSANPHVFLNQINGTNFTAANLTNGIIGGWAISNGTDFSSYTNVGGVTALGSGISGVSSYSANALGAGVLADNISVNATVQNVTARTINSLAVRAPAAATTIALNGTDVLNIGTGGFLINTAQTVAVQGGRLTAGGAAAAPASLYIYNNGAGLQQLNTPVVNNGANAVTLVRSGGGALNLQPFIVQTTTPTASTSLTVQNSGDLFVGMTVSGTGFAANTKITAIAGNVVTLSAAATAATNSQTVFTPPAIAASTTTAGSTTVTLGSAAPSGIVVGMAVGGPNIPGGTTVAAVSGTSLTLSQPAIISGTSATVTIGAPSNTYTGGTINNGGSSVFGVLNLSGQAGSIVIPGDLTIGNAAVNMITNQGQIARTSNVTWVSGGTLTLVGNNTLNSLNFNGDGTSGGTSTAAIGVGAAGSGASLALSAASAITATNNDLGHTPVINGLSLSLTNAAPVINTSGLSPNDLIINAPIISAGGAITKSGTGSVILNPTTGALTVTNTSGTSVVTLATGTLGLAVGQSVAGTGVPAGATIASITSPTTFTLSANTTAAATSVTVTGSTFTNGVNLNQGSIIFGAGSVGTPPTITNGPLGTGTLTLSGGTAGSTILSDGTARTIGNAVSVTGGGFTFGGTVAGNSTTLSGIVALGAGANTVNVTSPLVTGTISGRLTGGTNFTKSGDGILLLSNAANNYGGTTTVGGGVLKLGNAAAIPIASDTTISAGAELDINGTNNSAIRSLNGTGIVTNSGGAATLFLGGSGTSDATTNATGTFGGVITNAANALNLYKTGIGTQTLTSANSFTGNVNIGTGSAGPGGILAITHSLALGTGNKTVTIVSNDPLANHASLQLDGSTANGPVVLGSNISFTTSQANLIQPAIVNVAGNNIINGNFTLTGGGGSTSIFSTAGSLQLAGTFTTSTNNRFLILGGSSTGTGTVSGAIGQGSVPNQLALQKEGTNTWTLSGANTYTGATRINAGKLAAGVASVANVSGAFGNNSAVVFANVAGAALDITGFDTQVGSLSGGGTTGGNVILGAATLTTGGDNTSPAAYAGVISGTGGLIKTGSGTQTLTGINTYVGDTTVSNGRLNVNGSITSNTTVANGATLGGDGTITGAVSLSGILRPGQGGGTDRNLTIDGTVTTIDGSSLSFTVTDMASHDQLIMGGVNSIGLNGADLAVTFDSALIFTELGAGLGDDFLANPDSVTSSWFRLISGNTIGMFANVTETMSSTELDHFGLTGTQFKTNQGGQDFWVAQGSTYLVAIPEPGTAALGLLGTALLLRRRRKAV